MGPPGARDTDALLAETAERRLTENELRLGRDFAERLIAAAKVAVVVLDCAGRIKRFNPYFAELAGYVPDEVYEKNWVATFLPQLAWKQLQARLQKLLPSDSVREISPLVTKDGQQREFEWTATLLRNEQQEGIGILLLGRDLTAERHIQAQFQSLINTTQDAVVAIDCNGIIELFNPAAEHIFGYNQEEVLGNPVQILMPEPYAREHDGYIKRYRETGEAHAIGRIRTVAARRKNGEIFPIELSITELHTPGNPRYGAFIRDISEKVRLQERLVERERLAAIGTTAATFAHEVGNPLNSMFVAAQLLQRYFAKNTTIIERKAEETLESLTKEIKRLNRLLHEFRALAQRQDLKLRLIPLQSVITDILRVEAPFYQANGVQAVEDVPPKLPLIEVDPEKLKQALLNLCKNAVEAMPKGGTLTIKARATNLLLFLSVSDTGVGIPPGLEIFEPFITTKTQGTGLGLTVVRQIVAAHKGTLTYSSTLGVGTTFTIEIPIQQKK